MCKTTIFDQYGAFNNDAIYENIFFSELEYLNLQTADDHLIVCDTQVTRFVGGCVGRWVGSVHSIILIFIKPVLFCVEQSSTIIKTKNPLFYYYVLYCTVLRNFNVNDVQCSVICILHMHVQRLYCSTIGPFPAKTSP